MPDAGLVMIYTTWPDEAAAIAAGERLVAQELAACVNVLGPATAVFMWQGKTERATEVPMLIKTAEKHIEAVALEIGKLHPYEVPAVAALPIVGGNVEFLNWIDSQTIQSPPKDKDLAE